MQAQPEQTQLTSTATEERNFGHDAQLKKSCTLLPQTQSLNRMGMQKDGNECSYCHKGLSYSVGMLSNYLIEDILLDDKFEPYVYELLMERGWRRCGTYYYKNDLEKSCCKQWTHRLDVNEFKIKKDQRKTVRKMMTLAYEQIEPIAEEESQKQDNKRAKNDKYAGNKQKPSGSSLKTSAVVSQQYQDVMKTVCQKILEYLNGCLFSLVPSSKINKDQTLNWQILDRLKFFKSKPEDKSDYYCNFGMLLYGCNKKFFNAKDYPLTEFVKDIKVKVQKVANQGQEDYFVELERGGYLVLELSKKLKEKQMSEEFQVIQEKQCLKGKDQSESNKCIEEEMKQLKNKSTSSKFLKLQPDFRGQLKITTDKITFGNLHIDLVEAEESHQSYEMYKSYCKLIHDKEKQKMSSYTNFLCQKGLSYQTEEKTVPTSPTLSYQPSFDPNYQHQKPKTLEANSKVSKRMGCFHMKYYLKEKLIGIGVVDILPHGLSSVYFFYDPQYKDYRLGVFSSIIEIEYIRYLSLTFPEFKNYYLGFYIHNNEKMSYKGDYEPYQLLCPVTYKFVNIDKEVKKKIDRICSGEEKSVRLAEQGVKMDEDMDIGNSSGVHIDKTLKLTYKGRKLTLKDINPQIFVPVLTILKNFLLGSGKEVFDILTFTF